MGKQWTPADAKRLQKLTRQIIKRDGGDHNIRKMAYEVEARNIQAREQSGEAALEAKIIAQADVKALHALECRGGVWYYQIETPFETFPKFVIGETDVSLEKVKQIHKCSARENSDRAWECLMKTGSFKGLIPDLDSLLAPAGKETASDA